MLAWTKTAAALLVFWFVGLSSAHGAWRAVEGIDMASGQASLLLIGELDAQTGLYARCVAGEAEMFLDGFDGGDFEIAPVGPVNLIIATDSGKTWSSEARYGREKSGYVTTTWLTRETISAAIAELAAAKSAISISIEFADTGDVSTWDTDAKGSTAAARRFLDDCPQTRFSDEPESGAPQGTAPRIQGTDALDPYTDWTTAIGDSVTLPDVRAVLMGRTSPASAMVQMTCGMDPQMWSVGLTAAEPSAIAIRDTDGPFAISLTVDGTTWTFPDAQYLGSSTGLSVIADVGTDLAGALIMLTLSFNPAILTVTGASGQAHVYTAGVFGMAEASMAMSKACLG